MYTGDDAVRRHIVQLELNANRLRYLQTKSEDLNLIYQKADVHGRENILKMFERADYRGLRLLLRSNNKQGLTYRELQAIAKENGVVNYTHMRKDRLYDLLVRDGFLIT